MIQEYRLEIPAVLERVDEVCEFVAQIARATGMDNENVYRCYLAVEEVCTNIIEHGYRYEGSSEVIDVVCVRYPNRLEITITDDALPFNPLRQPEPDPTAPLLERQAGGWGIYFVKRYMDTVRYHYSQNRNQLTLEKHF